MLNQHKPLTPELVEPTLHGRLGRPYLWSESCPTTQEALRDPALPEGAVAVTEHQTAGRGRAGRSWVDEPGAALLVSVLLRPPAVSVPAQLSLVCALAVAETVERACHRDAGIKWPNDILVDGRKVAGILLDGHEGAVVCGIGVNVSQTEETLPRDVRLPPASLHPLTGREQDRAALLVLLLERLEVRYDDRGDGARLTGGGPRRLSRENDAWLAEGLSLLLPGLERRDALLGRDVQVGHLGGVGAGIAPDGRLRLLRPDGTPELVASGEVNTPL